MENSQKPQTKTIAGLIGFIVLLAVAVLGLVTAYYFQSDHVASLEYQVAHLKTSAEDAQKEPVKNEEVPAAVMYREIPELGVKYELTDQTKDLTYSFRSNEDGTVRTADFSTIAISAMKGTGIEEFPCTSPMAPSGSFTLYKNGNEILQGRMVKDIAKKVGNYYFVYAHPQYACSLTPNSLPSVEGLQASIDAVKAAFDSLEAM